MLSGNSHDYERFAPLDRNGNLDPAAGIRQFVVGTGGAFFTGLSSQIANSEVAQHDTFGVLKLTLSPDSYSWTFVPEAGKTFTDSGATMCHGLVGPPPPDAIAPVISGLTLTNTRFRVDRTGTAAAAKRGTTFRYLLSEAAIVRFTIERRLKWRLVDGRCRRPTRQNRDARACTQYRRVGSFRRSATAGANKTKFRGTVDRRWVRPGPYRATLRATDRAGNRSQRKPVRFKVVRR